MVLMYTSDTVSTRCTCTSAATAAAVGIGTDTGTSTNVEDTKGSPAATRTAGTAIVVDSYGIDFESRVPNATVCRICYHLM